MSVEREAKPLPGTVKIYFARNMRKMVEVLTGSHSGERKSVGDIIAAACKKFNEVFAIINKKVMESKQGKVVVELSDQDVAGCKVCCSCCVQLLE